MQSAGTRGSKRAHPRDRDYRGWCLTEWDKQKMEKQKKHEIKEIYTTVQNTRQLLYHKVPMKEGKK
jgi:hypothetical protein